MTFVSKCLSIKRMFSNKPQLGLPKHYSFDIYSIRIPPTEAYQGQHFDFSKGVPSKHIKNGGLWSSFGCLRYIESFSEPQSMRRRLARASRARQVAVLIFNELVFCCPNTSQYLINALEMFSHEEQIRDLPPNLKFAMKKVCFLSAQ